MDREMTVMTFPSAFRRLLHDEAGQDLIEYALLAVFISIIAITAITSIGQSVNTLYGTVGSAVD